MAAPEPTAQRHAEPACAKDQRPQTLGTHLQPLPAPTLPVIVH